MYSRFLLLLCFCLATVATASAQSLRGKVTNANGKPIEGIQVFNERTNKHTHTNELGVFVLENTEPNDMLMVGGLGYKTVLLAANPSEALLIALEDDAVRLDEVVVHPRLAGLSFITAIDLKVLPVNSSQELLQKVPGLFIGQHAGGGKAEQLFLRGFDVDHGTDVAISVDGMPVNMVSQAHGQGYADLHFLIPETVDKLDFGKGSYYADKGDFNTAGYVSFQTKDKLDKNLVGVELGQFNTRRILGMFNVLEQSRTAQDAYFASELLLTDGPFKAPQNFNRINLFGKYTARFNDDSKLSLNVSHFTSKWDASGQIPQRWVDAGIIPWFGAIDPTEGGSTSRTNINASFFKSIDDHTTFKANLFFTRYAFELYSNFTFFLLDTLNGDQIRQKENRNIIGLNSEWARRVSLGNAVATLQAGLGFRADGILNAELSHTKGRVETLETLMLGDIDQTNLFAYLSAQLEVGKLMVVPALRLDQLQMGYQDKLAGEYENRQVRKALLLPKLSLIFTASDNLQLYAKSGVGFHSNDVRVVVFNADKKTLPRSVSADVGGIWKPIPHLIFNGALWGMYSQQEFVYVGDIGVVEPSGRTRRLGFDAGARYQLTRWLFLDGDANYAFARFIDEPSGGDYVPLAPRFTATGGVGLNNLYGFSGSLRFRHMGDRPANEDGSIMAKGFTLVDFSLNYQYKGLLLGVTIENLLNTKWRETQFATESLLPGELNSVEEIHFTPGAPFFFRARVVYSF